MQIEVKSKSDENKVGILTVLNARLGRFRQGDTLKVYNQRRDSDRVILYCTGYPGGYVGQAVLTNGNFTTGDHLLIESAGS